ncbi:DUF3606 domain-containing protein [Mesorhizobium sp. M0208]|uniref:DUF3606 domain-containing protein n=2 Tax=unclassified Mesorhizobium TaxID=325217 RepID=UPI00333A15DB
MEKSTVARTDLGCFHSDPTRLLRSLSLPAPIGSPVTLRRANPQIAACIKADPRREGARRTEMADDKSKRDFSDRKRVSVDEYYEVEYFARENGVSPSQVSKLIKRTGGDRMILSQAVKALRERK